MTAAVALAVAGLVVISRGASFTDVVAVVVGPALLWLCWRAPGVRTLGTWSVAASAVGAAALTLALGHGAAGYTPVVAGLGAGWLLLLGAALAGRGSPRAVAWGAVALAALSSAVLVWQVHGDPSLDVWSLHRRAAGHLAAGTSPWRGLGVDNGSAFVPDSAVIDGYPYPVPTLVAYALGTLLVGEPRWTGILLWVGSLAGLAVAVRGRRRAAVLVVLLAMAPGWAAVLRNAWTEPLALALVVGAVLLWDTRPAVSAALLGVALTSKQYLAVPALALLVAPLPDRRRRLGVAAAAGAAAVLGGLLLGPGYLDAVVGFHLGQPPRPDSANLFGLLADAPWGPTGWPAWVGLVAGGPAAVLLGRRAQGPAGLVWAFAGSLSATFLLASQAFPNYWFLVLGLVVTAAITGDPPASPRPETPRSGSLRSPPG